MKQVTRGGGGDESGEPWERPVREITLAARSDVIDDMRGPWSTYLDAIKDCARQLSKIWESDLEQAWRGDAANACHGVWMELVKSIGKFEEHYSVMPDVLKAASSAVTDARETIPIPVFNGDRLPGDSDSETGSATDKEITGGVLYDNYQKNSASYEDYEFLERARQELAQGETPVGVRQRGKSGYGINGTVEAYEHRGLTSDRKAARRRAIDEWYDTHQSLANAAKHGLLADYAHTKSRIPEPFGEFVDPADDDGHDGSGDHHLPGGGDGSGLAYGAGTFGAAGGAGIGAGAVHAAMPSVRHSALPSPPSSITDGIRLAGDASPTGQGTVSSTGLSGGAGSRLPMSWSTAPSGGIGGAGSFGAVGAGGTAGGFGGVGIASTSPPSEGWWNRSPGGRMGPAAASPGAQLAVGRGGTAAGSRGPGGVGMMPNAGGAGNRQRDERSTWLTEDDADIFRTKEAPPGLIE